MAKTIDLNADLGEGFGPWPMGDDASMLGVVSSANVACGGHASDPDTMFETLKLAEMNQVIVGAHPGYNDREGFGRRIIPMNTNQIANMVSAQIGALMGVAALVGINIAYVKPHGALANLAAKDSDVAKAIVDAVHSIDSSLPMLAISGTEVELYARRKDRAVFSEIFADRAYLASGQLVPRNHPKAMIADPSIAADRLIEFLETGLMPVIDGKSIELNADSICVHGDSPTAVAMAQHISERLYTAGYAIKPFIGLHD